LDETEKREREKRQRKEKGKKREISQGTHRVGGQKGIVDNEEGKRVIFGGDR